MSSRYSRDPLARLGRSLGSHEGANKIYRACKTGAIKTKVRIMKENERLDIIAGQEYGDANLWWVIAAASGIAWPLQVPPGIVLRIPIDYATAMRYLN